MRGETPSGGEGGGRNPGPSVRKAAPGKGRGKLLLPVFSAAARRLLHGLAADGLRPGWRRHLADATGNEIRELSHIDCEPGDGRKILPSKCFQFRNRHELYVTVMIRYTR